MPRMNARTLILLAGMACVTAAPALELETGLTLIGQAADGDAEASASADLFFSGTAGATRWLLHLEAGSTPASDAVSAHYPQANGDLGSALNADDAGRVQLSELLLERLLSGGWTLVGGLIDASGFVDRSRVANDEARQFLGASFVNNPSINFPDYAPGLALYRPLADGRDTGLSLVLASSNGLADNPSHSYGELLRGGEGRGSFAAAALRQRLGHTTLRGGAWINTRRVQRLDRIDTHGRDGRGLFASIGRSLVDGVDANVRLGLADERYAEADRFASLAVIGGAVTARTGIAASVAWPSKHLGSERAPALQAELFHRWSPFGDSRVELTPSLQYIDNAELRAGPAGWVLGLRLHLSSGHTARRLR